MLGAPRGMGRPEAQGPATGWHLACMHESAQLHAPAWVRMCTRMLVHRWACMGLLRAGVQVAALGSEVPAHLPWEGARGVLHVASFLCSDGCTRLRFHLCPLRPGIGAEGWLKPEVPPRPEGIFFWAYAVVGAGHGDSEVRQPGWLFCRRPVLRKGVGCPWPLTPDFLLPCTPRRACSPVSQAALPLPGPAGFLRVHSGPEDGREAGEGGSCGRGCV